MNAKTLEAQETASGTGKRLLSRQPEIDYSNIQII